MQALINFVIRNLLALWPIARVYSWEQGVRIRNGVLREEVGPGLHWRWWFVDEFYRVSAAEKTIDLRVGTITTTDGHSAAISANITYRVRSVRAMWQNVHQVEDSLRDLALGFLAEECSGCTWEALRDGRSGLHARLAEHMTDGVSSWGVEVVRVHLTDLVRAKPYRFFGSTPHPSAG